MVKKVLLQSVAIRSYLAAMPILGSLLILQPDWVWAEDPIEKSLNAASEALGRDALEEADQLFTQVTNAEKASRHQRATSFAGRCAVRYKKSLSTKNPAMIPQAINDCDRAIELKSDMQQAYRIRGVALLSAGHPDRAVEDLSVAVALHPDDYLAFQNRALALVKLGRSRDALAELDAAIRLKPDHPWSYYNRGRLRVVQGEHEAAIDDFISFIRFKRDHEEVYRLRGQSRMLIGLPQQAIGDFYESLRLRPANNPDAHMQRGIAFALLERFAEAEQDLATALPLQPGNLENRLWLFLVRERLGKPGKEVLSDPSIRLDAAKWPDALVSVFLGSLPADKAVEAARKSDDPVESRLRENLTLLLLGQRAYLQGHSEEATRWLSQVKGGQGREAPYFRTAQQELRLVASRQAVGSVVPPYPPQSPRAGMSAPPPTKPAASGKEKEAPAAPPESGEPASEPVASSSAQGSAPAKAVESPQAKVTPPAAKETREPAETPAPQAHAVKQVTPEAAQSEVPLLRAPGAPGRGNGPVPARAGTATAAAKPAPIAATTGPSGGIKVNPKDLQGKYLFKVASYSNAAYAQGALAHYAGMGVPVFQEQGQAQDKAVHRVWVGPFNEQAQAVAVRERIRALPNQNPAEVIKR